MLKIGTSKRKMSKSEDQMNLSTLAYIKYIYIYTANVIR